MSGLFVLVGVALLVSLGAWQLQRRVWKEHLLARIAALQSAPPEPLSVVFNRLRDGGEVDFVRVVAPCESVGPKSVHLYGVREASGPADVRGGGPAWRQIASCRLPAGPYGSLLVDTGFEAGPFVSPPPALPMPAGRGPVRVTGVLRTPEPPPWFASLIGEGAAGAKRSQANGQWFQRDVPGMAAALGADRPAPVMLMLESPAAGPGLTPAPLPVDIPNRHLEYALTWFGLAATLVVFYAVTLVRGRRRG